jgi:UDP-GlcNAc:undecaprenyl-phosphate GlcNAc-1-phosphate transferase
MIAALALTPAVKRFALRIGAIDVPNHRKVHTKTMPRLGGLAIYIAFAAASLLALPFLPEGFFAKYDDLLFSLWIGGAIIVLTGALDDKFDLPAKVKLVCQIAAACLVVFGFGIRVNLLNLPFGEGGMHLETWIGIPLTILWIVGVTNAINLIDGLDGLAAGVSGIAIVAMLAVAAQIGNPGVILLCTLLLGGIIGFLFFNFHPAKIFMGDSGALFLGFSLAILSLYGFKQVTLVSFITPLLIIGVPLSDTFFAIVRRWVNKKPIFAPDKGHLHHCLRELGFSHRQTVLIIYGIAAFFSACAIVFPILLTQAATWVTVIAICAILLILQIGAEIIGIVDKTRRPVLNMLARLRLKPQTHSRSK